MLSYVSCSCAASLLLTHKWVTLAFFKLRPCGHASTDDACRMRKCALITAWWCGHAALIKLWQPTDIRSNAPNPGLSRRAATLLPNKGRSKQERGGCIHFVYVGEEKGWYLNRLGWGGRGGSLVGGPAQKWVRMGMGFTSKCQWQLRDQRVSCIHWRASGNCFFGPKSINHWVLVVQTRFW